jgi:Methyltransferase FkbM domain
MLLCGGPNAQVENKFAMPRDGWKPINVFYGKEDHLSTNWIKGPDKQKKWFSQFKQDEVIVALLRGKRNGYFIDLAANHALRLSNTYTLEASYGWNGLCIEPNPRYWVELAYRKCQVAAAVVGKHRLEEISYSFPKVGAYGGIAREGFDQSGADESVQEKRYTVPLQEILERAGVPPVIDYFSLDVEGAEWVRARNWCYCKILLVPSVSRFANNLVVIVNFVVYHGGISL